MPARAGPLVCGSCALDSAPHSIQERRKRGSCPPALQRGQPFTPPLIPPQAPPSSVTPARTRVTTRAASACRTAEPLLDRARR